MSSETITAIAGSILAQPIPFVRPTLPGFDCLRDELGEIIQTGQLTKGRHLARFEQRLAQELHVKHAIGVSSCTSGLMLVYQGLDLEGEVILPSFTFMATATALEWAGLTPVFVDVKSATTNIDPSAVEAAISPRTSAIVAVHNFGNPAEIDALSKIAERHGLRLIFDSAHGFGSRFRGAPVGSQGDAHVFSLSPTKLLVAGEGGIIATNDDALAESVRLGREYGNDGQYDCLFAGMNARMPEVSALIGFHGLRLLEDVVEQRNQTAVRYQQRLLPLPGIDFLDVHPSDRCSYKDFSIVIDPEEFGVTRDTLRSALAQVGVQTRAYYDPPVHRQAAFEKYADDATTTANH